MWQILILALFWNCISPQPLEDNVRQPRRAAECCPCPGSRASDEVPVAPVDCPCLAGDSEGASSILFPTSVRAAKPFMKQSGTNEDLKPIFNPEVDLASSVLETLREVTDEEYEDAVARDAAKDIPMEDNFEADETAPNIVTIILNHKEDDSITDGTHIQEARCIQPLERQSINSPETLKLSRSKTPSILENLFTFPKTRPRLFQKNVEDSGVDASNINHHINKGLQLDKNPSLKWLLDYKNSEKETFNKFPWLHRNKNLNSDNTNSVDDNTETQESQSKNRVEMDFQNTGSKLKPLLTKENKNSLNILERANRLKDVEMLPLHNKKPLTLGTKTLSLLPSNFIKNKQNNILKNPISTDLIGFSGKKSRATEDLRDKDNCTPNKETLINTTPHDMRHDDIDVAPSPSEMKPLIMNPDITPIENMQDTNVFENTESDLDTNILLDSMGDEVEQDEMNTLSENNAELKKSGCINENELSSHIEDDSLTRTESLEDIKSDNINTNSDRTEVDNTDDIIEEDKHVLGSVSNEHAVKQSSKITSKGFKDEVNHDENIDQITIQDLQKMSNDILDQSLQNRDQNLKPLDCLTTNDVSDFNDNDGHESVNTIDVGDFNKIKNSTPKEIQNELHGTAFDSGLRQDAVETVEELKEKLNNCQHDLELLQKMTLEGDPSESSAKSTELISEASSPSVNTLPSPLNPLQGLFGQNPLVQPFSLSEGSGLNIFRNPLPDIGNLLNLNTHFPTLDDISSQISNIFDMSDRESDDDEEFIPEARCSNSNPKMSASAPKFKSVFPAGKALDEINMDIFQLKPLKLSEPVFPKLPTLNLNRYKARLALPKSLGLKPVKLESSVKSNRGLLGASLSFTDDKNSNIFRSSKLSKKGLLGSPLVNIPSLDDLGEKIRETTDSLFQPSVALARNPLSNILNPNDALSDLSENLRTQTRNTMKNIQELGSKLGVHDNSLRSSFARPEDIFHIVTDAHDDLNDKLKGIQHDLNDRLESIHDHISDQFRMPTQLSPLFKPKTSDEITKLRTASSLKTENRKKPENISRIPQSRTSNQQSSKTVVDRSKYKPKIQSAASIPVQRTANPNLKSSLKTLPKKNPKTSSQQNTFFVNESGKTANSLLDLPKSERAWRIPPNPFVTSKIKIDFPTVSKAKGKVKSSINAPKPKPSINLNNKEKFKVKNPVPSLGSKSQGNFNGKSELARSSSKSSLSPLKPTWGPTTTLSKSSKKKTALDFQTPLSTSWPKVTENAFLNKVRDAVLARLSNFGTLEPRKATRSKTEELRDVGQAASQNLEVVAPLDEPIRENTAYKCRMICTKDTK